MLHLTRHPQKHMYIRWNFCPISFLTEVITTSGFAAAILYFTYMPLEFRVGHHFIVLAISENMVLAFETVVLYQIQQKILLLPVSRPPY